MALPGEVQVGRFSRFFSKWTGSKGPSGRFTFGTEIAPQLQLWSGVENRWLESWNKFTASFNIAALAAQQGMAKIRNPVGSGVVAVVEKCTWFPVVAVDTAEVHHGPSVTDLTVGTGNRLDARMGATAASALIVSQSSTGVAFGNLIGFMAAPNGRTPDEFIHTDNQEIPVLPGDAFGVLNTSVNVQVIVTIGWRERVLEESERQ